jgi:hypothetical protein
MSLLNFYFFNASFYRVISWVTGFSWRRTLSRVPDIQFTRELFLLVAEVHILLLSHGNLLRRLFWPPSERSKNMIFAIFHSLDFLGAFRRIRKLKVDVAR